MAVRHDDPELGREAPEMGEEEIAAGTLRLQHGDAVRDREFLHRGGTSTERERPCGLSGWVTTDTISAPSSRSARRLGTAKAGSRRDDPHRGQPPAVAGLSTLMWPSPRLSLR